MRHYTLTPEAMKRLSRNENLGRFAIVFIVMLVWVPFSAYLLSLSGRHTLKDYLLVDGVMLVLALLRVFEHYPLMLLGREPHSWHHYKVTLDEQWIAVENQDAVRYKRVENSRIDAIDIVAVHEKRSRDLLIVGYSGEELVILHGLSGYTVIRDWLTRWRQITPAPVKPPPVAAAIAVLPLFFMIASLHVDPLTYWIGLPLLILLAILALWTLHRVQNGDARLAHLFTIIGGILGAILILVFVA